MLSLALCESAMAVLSGWPDEPDAIVDSLKPAEAVKIDVEMKEFDGSRVCEFVQMVAKRKFTEIIILSDRLRERESA
jgi:hypothetical protein